MARGATAGNAGNGSKWIRRERRIAIYERDGWRCVWCQCHVLDARQLAEAGPQPHSGSRLATLDHFLPRTRGGTNRNDNLLTCCMQCNHDRGDMSALEWATQLAAEGRTEWGAGQERARILERALQALDREVVRAPRSREEIPDERSEADVREGRE